MTFGDYIGILAEESLRIYDDNALSAYKLVRIGYAFMRDFLYKIAIFVVYSEYPDSDEFVSLLVTGG